MPNIYIHIYVCMYVCIYIYMYIYIRRGHEHAFLSGYIYMYVCMYVYMYMYMYTRRGHEHAFLSGFVGVVTLSIVILTPEDLPELRHVLRCQYLYYIRRGQEHAFLSGFVGVVTLRCRGSRERARFAGVRACGGQFVTAAAGAAGGALLRSVALREFARRSRGAWRL
jgi:hypothetical protein